jgi:hypothetical protein
MGLKIEPTITQVTIEVVRWGAMATLDELERLAQARVLETVCNHPRQGRELRSERRGSHSEVTE